MDGAFSNLPAPASLYCRRRDAAATIMLVQSRCFLELWVRALGWLPGSEIQCIWVMLIWDQHLPEFLLTFKRPK